MNRFLVLLFATVLAAFGAAAQQQEQTDSLSAEGGDIQITPVMHSSVQLEYAGKVIQVDPVAKFDNVELPLLGKLSALKSADLILITDIHPENLDVDEIVKLRKPGAAVIVPQAVAMQVGGKLTPPPVVLNNGDMKSIADISIEAVPMYNIMHGPKPGEPYHPKGRGNGYILSLGGKRIYFSGDTECTPEIKALKNIDVAFLPMNMPTTMTPSETVECIKAFQPKIFYPYHYEGQKRDEALVKAFLKDSPTEIRVNLK